MPFSAKDVIKIHKKATLHRETSFKQRFVDKCVYLPLLAAVFAPLATLLDIPGLVCSYMIYSPPGDVPNSVRDPQGSIVLSALSLAFSLVANVLIYLRFTVSAKYWKKIMYGSVISWVIKVAISLTNLCIYGKYVHNTYYIYGEGFYCNAISVILSGLIAIALVTHLCVRGHYSTSEGAGEDIRVAGARYQAAVTAFLSVIAIQALVFCKVEGWSYLQAIYFAEVTALTIGFGDYEPTYTVTRILDFPFAVLSISLLAVLLTQLVTFIASRTSSRKDAYRKIFEEEYTKSREEADKDRKHSLVVELAELQQMEKMEERMNQLFDLLISAISMVVFWVAGALIFHALEGWPIGSSFYFCYVFFLTIGYGDESPAAPVGRAFFVVYALLAVPVVTNFVVQTVVACMNRMADRLAEKARNKRAPDESELAAYHSHAFNVCRMNERLDKQLPAPHEKEQLAEIVLRLAVKLETQSRALLLDHLPSDSKGALLLRADRLVQLRAQSTLEKSVFENHPTKSESLVFDILKKIDLTDEENEEETDLKRNSKSEEERKEGKIRTSKHAEESDKAQSDVDIETQDKEGGLLPAEQVDEKFLGQDLLTQINDYRTTTAALLAAGSKLLQLEDDEKWYFERRLKGAEELDYGGIILGGGRQGQAEKKMGVDV